MSDESQGRARDLKSAWPVFAIILLIGIAFWGAFSPRQRQVLPERNQDVEPGRTYKVLYVDSYHPTYPPNASIHKGVEDVLLPNKVKIRYTYMDAKHRKTQADQRTAAVRIRREIEEWQPDIVIAADDSASKYLIEPYYKDAGLPVVFIGVNWDSEQYGYPYSNATGQVEVEMVAQLIDKLKEFSKGARVGLLSGNTLTDRNTLNHYRNVLKLEFDKVYLVDDYQDWCEKYRKLQGEVDLIILRNNAGIAGWDEAGAGLLVQQATRVPTGTVSSTSHSAGLGCTAQTRPRRSRKPRGSNATSTSGRTRQRSRRRGGSG